MTDGPSSPTPYLMPVEKVDMRPPCPRCGAQQCLQGLTYYQCGTCGYRDGPPPRSSVGTATPRLRPRSPSPHKEMMLQLLEQTLTAWVLLCCWLAALVLLPRPGHPACSAVPRKALALANWFLLTISR